MRYELVIIWDDGTKEVHECASIEEGEDIKMGLRSSFGNQIAWCGVREKRE